MNAIHMYETDKSILFDGLIELLKLEEILPYKPPCIYGQIFDGFVMAQLENGTYELIAQYDGRSVHEVVGLLAEPIPELPEFVLTEERRAERALKLKERDERRKNANK